MNKKFWKFALEIILIIMNVSFIAITLQSQNVYQLIFNATTIILNILYYVIDFIPENV